MLRFPNCTMQLQGEARMSYYSGSGNTDRDQPWHSRPKVEDILCYPCPTCDAAPQQWCSRVLGKDLKPTGRNKLRMASGEAPSHDERMWLAQGHDPSGFAALRGARRSGTPGPVPDRRAPGPDKPSHRGSRGGRPGPGKREREAARPHSLFLRRRFPSPRCRSPFPSLRRPW